MKGGITMKSMSIALATILTLAPFSIVPLLAEDPGNGNSQKECKLQGAWFTGISSGFGGWMMTFNGTGDNKGTTDWEFPLEDDPFYPDGTWTIGRGIWAKSGPNSYDYTFQAYFLDDSGIRVYSALNKGTLTLTGCNTAEIEGIAEFYDADMEPVIWCPESGCPYGPVSVFRLCIDQEFPIP
jgi:hypothetical protein